jgi:hypothetical protein
MPPAFNLSQDQTLQFDLEFALRNRSELHFYFHERLRSFNHGPCGPWHSPSNAHAYRLLIFKELRDLLGFVALLISDQRRPRFSLFFQSPVKHSVIASLLFFCVLACALGS